MSATTLSNMRTKQTNELEDLDYETYKRIMDTSVDTYQLK